jgi:hypothetical protein
LVRNMRLKPLVVPNRSRKLLPRLVMVDVDDTVELIAPGVGDGVGVGVGVGDAVGVGVGVGVGLSCACADDTPRASTNAIAASRANARPRPILSARDAQRINSIPEKSARSKRVHDKLVGRPGFAPSSYGASIGYGSHQGLNRSRCCSAATGGLVYPVLALSKPGQIKVPSGETCPEILQISPSRRTLPLASSRSASG